MKSLKKAIFVLIAVLLIFIIAACGGDPLQDLVDEINADESMHEELEGLYIVHAEARGESSIVIKFRAELEELADPAVTEAVSESVASEFQEALQEMRNARISDPKIVLEFFDMGGNLIYSHEFS